MPSSSNSTAEAERLKAAGNTLFRNGDYAGAVVKYKEAVTADPGNPAYWYGHVHTKKCSRALKTAIFAHSLITTCVDYVSFVLEFAFVFHVLFLGWADQQWVEADRVSIGTSRGRKG